MNTEYRIPPINTGHSIARPRKSAGWEWPTILLFIVCYAVLALGLFWLSLVSVTLAAAAITLALVLHSSLSHEILHGHPFPSQRVNTALGVVQPGLFIPFIRFRDTHLAHHRDARLTDPYDDPESNYLDPDVWSRLPRWQQHVLSVNNTLLGRMTVGPLVAQWAFMRGDLALIRGGDRAVTAGWLWHLPGLMAVLALVAWSPMPLWAYVAAAYAALAILKIRTFLEHQAHARSRGRTVIIEDRGPLAFLFLNNNLHVVHHMHPRLPWYRLPALYAAHRTRFLACNDGYMFRSYAQIFARFFLTAKDPVAHPLWRRD
ncbi:fatty acid desaturase [Pseudosulfitobacter koreensis]|uniref:Fatty acid desaturase n=1 Tax=Pseudosulfitobacter koreensis TaxID=2968472 RepID=A0ABT1Z4S6_9RHOB|nr:fatty acid desaturase [Pseudosulfitobacter koreense]MCR8828138.1 fatty acid desaturase [Pseudosulfitobacter koreense]